MTEGVRQGNGPLGGKGFLSGSREEGTGGRTDTRYILQTLLRRGGSEGVNEGGGACHCTGTSTQAPAMATLDTGHA